MADDPRNALETGILSALISVGHEPPKILEDAGLKFRHGRKFKKVLD
jgi:hypothetical protein